MGIPADAVLFRIKVLWQRIIYNLTFNGDGSIAVNGRRTLPAPDEDGTYQPGDVEMFFREIGQEMGSVLSKAVMDDLQKERFDPNEVAEFSVEDIDNMLEEAGLRRAEAEEINDSVATGQIDAMVGQWKAIRPTQPRWVPIFNTGRQRPHDRVQEVDPATGESVPVPADVAAAVGLDDPIGGGPDAGGPGTEPPEVTTGPPEITTEPPEVTTEPPESEPGEGGVPGEKRKRGAAPAH